MKSPQAGFFCVANGSLFLSRHLKLQCECHHTYDNFRQINFTSHLKRNMKYSVVKCCWYWISAIIPVSVAVMSLPPMRKSSNYERRLFLFLAVVIFPTLRTATATDARSQPASAATVTNDTHAGAEIPTGFKVERYARVWERYPFTLVTPTAPPKRSVRRSISSS